MNFIKSLNNQGNSLATGSILEIVAALRPTRSSNSDNDLSMPISFEYRWSVSSRLSFRRISTSILICSVMVLRKLISDLMFKSFSRMACFSTQSKDLAVLLCSKSMTLGADLPS